MQKDFEATYHSVEENHWWFTSRRELVRRLVRRATPDRNAPILEIGCSGGPLLQKLRADGYAHLTGIDISEEAIALCARRGVPNVSVMDAQHLKFPSASFDVITASDVLEHLADAPSALREWHRTLRSGGTLFVFVPAFMFLWSEHDVANQHQHRYRATELKNALENVGFSVERRGYWNFLLFAPVALVRFFKKLFCKSRNASGQGDLKQTSIVTNTILKFLLKIENRILLAGFNFPCGVSAWAIARKP